jgi:Zn-dependent protease with chaperone function
MFTGWLDDALTSFPPWVPWASWSIVPASALASYVATGLAQWLPRRALTRLPAGAHWTERARLGFALRSTVGVARVLLALGAVGLGWSFVGPLTALGPLLPWVAGLAAWMGASAHVGSVRRAVGLPVLRLGTRLRDQAVVSLVLYSPLLVLVGGAMLGPRELGAGLALHVGCCSLALVALGRGWHLPLARAAGLLAPADPELGAAVRGLAGEAGVPLASVWQVEWSACNAFAFQAAQSVGFTRGAREQLALPELLAIAAHELGHLAEPPRVRLARSLGPVALAPLTAVRAASTHGGAMAPLALLCAVLVPLVLLRRLGRRMEEHADHAAHGRHGDEGAYARALSRVYEQNRMPAVMRGKGSTHPHLYDRLLAAGVTPDYPRPLPPPRAPAFVAAFGCVALLAGAWWTALDLRRAPAADMTLAQGALTGGDDYLFEALGYQRWMAGDVEGARTLYRAAAALRPEKALALAMLASFELDFGRCDEARELADAAHASARAEPPPHDAAAARRVLADVESTPCAPGSRLPRPARPAE